MKELPVTLVDLHVQSRLRDPEAIAAFVKSHAPHVAQAPRVCRATLRFKNGVEHYAELSRLAHRGERRTDRRPPVGGPGQ